MLSEETDPLGGVLLGGQLHCLFAPKMQVV
jgi:hypothetical protein